MNKRIRGINRQTRIRKKIRTVSDRARLSLFRSNKYLYVQIIDDKSGKTIIGASEKQVTDVKGTKTEKARALGTMIAKLAKEKKVTSVVFDKGRYSYHGRVKALADAAREGGLVF